MNAATIGFGRYPTNERNELKIANKKKVIKIAASSKKL